MIALMGSPTDARADTACPFETIGSATVRGALDARSVILDDGREVRLAGVETPDNPTKGDTTHLGRSGQEALESLLTGKTVTLKRVGPGTDRYGRVFAHVFVSDGGAERWIQQELVARGLARVGSRIGGKACAAALLAHEQRARTAKLGLWAEKDYVIGKAEDPAGLLAGRGRFAIVEGKVLTVRESGGTIYVNFGRRWSEDFTVTIAKRNERRFTSAGLVPKTLEGRQVRVRGWMEARGGRGNAPWVDAAEPEQIEVIGQN